MTDFFDRVAEAVKKERVWLPGQINEDGTVKRIQQVTVVSDGAPKGKHIFLSRKKPSNFEEQDLGTFRHNEMKRTVDVSEPDGKIVASDSTDNKGGVVYMKRIGAYVPRYKVEQQKTNRSFLKSLDLAREITERQARSNSIQEGALVNVGLGGNNTDSNSVVGGSS